jgi:hypothetical protein
MQKILLAIDFSPTTPLLIEKAKLLAPKFNSEVWLLPGGATSSLESRQGKLHSSPSSNVILQSMATNLH